MFASRQIPLFDKKVEKFEAPTESESISTAAPFFVLPSLVVLISIKSAFTHFLDSMITSKTCSHTPICLLAPRIVPLPSRQPLHLSPVLHITIVLALRAPLLLQIRRSHPRPPLRIQFE